MNHIQLETRVLGNLLKQVYIFDKRVHALKIKCVNNAYTFGNTTKATTLGYKIIRHFIYLKSEWCLCSNCMFKLLQTCVSIKH